MPRPKNPPPDRRQAILEAALRAFATRGYAAATNAEIAREAGVTAAALYYYFPSKADLFKAAISEQRDTFLPHLEQMAAELYDMPPEQVLPLFTQFLTGFLTQERTKAIMRVVLAEGPRNPEVVSIWQTQALGHVLPIVLGYLEHQMDLGRIRRMDTRVLGLLLNGPVLSTVILRDLLQVAPLTDVSNEALIQHATDLLLNGLIIAKKE